MAVVLGENIREIASYKFNYTLIVAKLPMINI